VVGVQITKKNYASASANLLAIEIWSQGDGKYLQIGPEDHLNSLKRYRFDGFTRGRHISMGQGQNHIRVVIPIRLEVLHADVINKAVAKHLKYPMNGLIFKTTVMFTFATYSSPQHRSVPVLRCPRYLEAS